MLDLHAATDDERIALHRNVHDVWGRGLPLDEHVQRRLDSPQHNRAAWFVGCLDDRVATSLGVYPLQFRCRGEIVPGMAIGAVHTHADFRGRGFAPELIRWVDERYRRENGTAISLLYSDIKPDYYARLGYVECPAWEFSFDPAAADADLKAPAVDLRPVPLADAVPVMRELYDTFHRDLPIAIHRGDDYWAYLQQKSPRDDVFVTGPEGNPAGYLRVGRQESSLVLRDVAAAPPDDAVALLAAVPAIARQAGVSRVTGWVPELRGELSPLTVRRTEEITMLKSLSPASPLDHSVTAAADWFHEIDHV